MEKLKIPEVICQYLNKMGVIKFIPEVWRDGCAMVSQTGRENIIRSYINGGEIIGIPIDIRIRCEGREISDRLWAMDVFRDIEKYIESTPLTIDSSEYSDLSLHAESVSYKSAVYDDGTEEYRTAYILKYYKK